MVDSAVIGRLLERVKMRLSGDEVKPDDGLIQEYIVTACDRICLRLGEKSLPELMQSIAVDVVIKMFRRQFYEGISSETTEFSTSFVEDILNEYEVEFKQYLSQSHQVVVKIL